MLVYNGTASLIISNVTDNVSINGYGGALAVFRGEIETAGCHFGENSAPVHPEGDDVWMDVGSSFTAQPCPDGYRSAFGNTLEVHGDVRTSQYSYTCTPIQKTCAKYGTCRI